MSPYSGAVVQQIEYREPAMRGAVKTTKKLEGQNLVAERIFCRSFSEDIMCTRDMLDIGIFLPLV